jgi:hypothetical protein
MQGSPDRRNVAIPRRALAPRGQTKVGGMEVGT